MSIQNPLFAANHTSFNLLRTMYALYITTDLHVCVCDCIVQFYL